MGNNRQEKQKNVCGMPDKRPRMSSGMNVGLMALEGFERDYFLLQMGKIKRSMRWGLSGLGQPVC